MDADAVETCFPEYGSLNWLTSLLTEKLLFKFVSSALKSSMINFLEFGSARPSAR
jgi:hypothetical protein